MAQAMKFSVGLNHLTRRAGAAMLPATALALGLCIGALPGSAAPAAPLQGLQYGAPALLMPVGSKGNKGNKNKNWSKNWNGKNYHGGHVRYWARKPYYGSFIGGVVLGTILGVGVVGVAPPPPGPQFCWYWTDPSMTRGYWDYCY
jgi:hypothetical protein